TIDKEAAVSSEAVRAAVRVLARGRPDGAVAALLNHLDRAENAGVTDEIRAALAAMAARDEKADPALVAALKDKSASKRGIAAHARCGAKTKDHLPALRKLLADEDEAVRLPVALALAKRGEKEAVGILIAFMDRPPSLSLGAAEDVLFRLAGQDSPRLEGDD